MHSIACKENQSVSHEVFPFFPYAILTQMHAMRSAGVVVGFSCHCSCLFTIENEWTAVLFCSVLLEWIGNWIAWMVQEHSFAGTHTRTRTHAHSKRERTLSFQFTSLHRFLSSWHDLRRLRRIAHQASDEQRHNFHSVSLVSLLFGRLVGFKFPNASHWLDSRSVNVA